MVIVVLSGGIGAQVFQFAAGYELSKKNNCGLIIDACWFKKNNEFATKPFTIDEFLDLKEYKIIKNIWISRILRFIFVLQHILTFGKYNYISANITNPLKFEKIGNFKNLFLNGYIQNIDYFKKYLLEILSKIKIHKKVKSDSDGLKKIAIHVRKGDQKDGPVDFLNNDYYQKGIDEILTKTKIEYENIKIVIFCEEMEWPKNNLSFHKRIKNIEYIIGDDNSAIIDLNKMMDCDYIIMSNSGYSWWAAAYIDKIKNGYVVCPDLWWNKISVDSTNIYLNDWIVIDTKIPSNKNPEFIA